MVESSRIKKAKKFDFNTKDGKHVHLTEEQINQQKNIEQEAKAEAARHEEKLLQPALTKEVKDGRLSKKIQERMDYLRTTEAELRIDLDRPLSKQGPLDRLNDLENKKRKHADDIHDFFRANKRLKSSV
ncbi:hypothetical protein Tco_1475860 [Tanacetum coccineum]